MARLRTVAESFPEACNGSRDSKPEAHHHTRGHGSPSAWGSCQPSPSSTGAATASHSQPSVSVIALS